MIIASQRVKELLLETQKLYSMGYSEQYIDAFLLSKSGVSVSIVKQVMEMAKK